MHVIVFLRIETGFAKFVWVKLERQAQIRFRLENMAHNSNQQQVMMPMPPPVPNLHQQQNNDGKGDHDMVSYVKMDEQALVKDFDANLSGLGVGLELNAGAYNMSEVLNLPIFKQEENIIAVSSNQSLPPLQYMLCAPTSPATKVHEETLTYLNQGHPYEIRLKRLRDLPNLTHSQLAKSFLRVVFHDRRLQYTEHQQLEDWKFSRPGDRLVNIDIPMSVGIIQPRQPPDRLNLVEFVWDLDKQASVYIQVHCISTEFTPKKHGGERGVPFRIQVDTYHLDSNGDIGQHIHSASCQIKVFKPKGADRKQKTDKDKMDRRSAQEKLKYQPSYDSTLLTECAPMPLGMNDDSVTVHCVDNKRHSFTENSLPPTVDLEISNQNNFIMDDATTSADTVNQSSISYGRLMEAVTTSNHQLTLMPSTDPPKFNKPLTQNATITHTQQWLQRNHFGSVAKMFNSFSGADMLSLSRDDLIQICGCAEGIRLFNRLRMRKIQPRLTIYMTPATPDAEGGIRVYRAFYLQHLTANELIKEASSLFEQQNGGGAPHITRALYQPLKSNVHVLVTDDLVNTLKDEQCFTVLVVKNEADGLQIILKQ